MRGVGAGGAVGGWVGGRLGGGGALRVRARGAKQNTRATAHANPAAHAGAAACQPAGPIEYCSLRPSRCSSLQPQRLICAERALCCLTARIRRPSSSPAAASCISSITGSISCRTVLKPPRSSALSAAGTRRREAVA